MEFIHILICLCKSFKLLRHTLLSNKLLVDFIEMALGIDANLS